jgi:muconolactone delta-isomerase
MSGHMTDLVKAREDKLAALRAAVDQQMHAIWSEFHEFADIILSEHVKQSEAILQNALSSQPELPLLRDQVTPDGTTPGDALRQLAKQVAPSAYPGPPDDPNGMPPPPPSDSGSLGNPATAG